MDGGTSDERSKGQTEERQKTPPKPPPETVTAEARQQQHPPPQKCPRCDSSNTKFCYYNNYSLVQPRYFCKACRRYWTHGGSLRNVPIGGGSRKAKRSRIASASFANSEIPCSTAGISSQNLAGMISGQSMRPMPPAVPTVGNSFYSSGGVMSNFGGVQSLQGGGMNQGAALSYGGGPCRFGANMSILQGMGISGFRNIPPPPQLQFHSPASDHGYPSQQSLSAWLHPSLLHIAGGGTTSAAASNACCNSAAGSEPVGASFSQNQWQESDPGFNPPH